jgi:2-phospho-L-lactate guanylyltransferase
MAPDDVATTARPAALGWSLVIPVKVLALAKSRLAGAGERRSDLALAMAADTIAAAISANGVESVVVVTDDPDIGKLALGLGAHVLPDEPAAGLNDALVHGADFSATTWPERGRAGLAADLPAAQPGELAAALAVAARTGSTAFVPDADGTGTVLYAAVPGAGFRPQFGPQSRDRHKEAGAVEIAAAEIYPAEIYPEEPGGPEPVSGIPGRAEPGAPVLAAAVPGVAGPGTAGPGTGGGVRVAMPLRGLRRDVDTIENLRAAAAIGLGPRTSALLAADSGILG